MKTLRHLCTPRESVFDRDRRDTVLDLTDLIDDRIQPGVFFEENYRTGNMRILFREAFRRFQRRSQQSTFLLTQAMGGGKTHNMIALGLLARHPEYRKRVMGGDYDENGLGKVRVVGFTGRESDAPLGIWGSIAEQLGKKEQFKDYYSPLQAPGQRAWEKLLQGDPLLILLDELPPYFENAKAKMIGNSDLARVSGTALANMLVAANKLDNVVVVISDLRATYEGGSQSLQKAVSDFESEAGRSAMPLEPVQANSDEVYHILRKRLFEDLPTENEIDSVAEAYAKAVRDAKQMDVTNASPDAYAAQIKESYPFHFTIRDLYARFRENPGFQQTRGLIRLMRTVVAAMYREGGRADDVSLIHPYDIDLNEKETFAEVTNINPTLTNAIAHDIADEGDSVAESIDRELGSGRDAQDAATLLLVASLANVPDAVKGLTKSEVVSYLCAPGRDISALQQQVLSPLYTSAWYLHVSSDGRLFFRNVENLVAKLKSVAGSFNRESQLRELRDFLAEAFEPTLKDCYQTVAALPAVDTIQVGSDKVTLVIAEPKEGGRLAPDLQAFYDQLDYKNRVLFLTGQKDTLDRLLETAAELKAIRRIIAEMEAERVSENDPQYQSALETLDNRTLRILSAARETFTTLLFPFSQDLRSADFLMHFSDNEYNGENQIRKALEEKRKFIIDVEGETFRKMLEDRLFTLREMKWSELKKRAAVETKWPWHRTDALDRLRDRMLREGQWVQEGDYINKQPPEPETSLHVHELHRDDATGEATLRLSPVNGDTIYYEVGAPATTASERLEDAQQFKTKELEVSFLCVDSSGEHETGPPLTWKNRITLQYRTWQDGDSRRVELQAAPPAPIRYTTDGSNPLNNGGIYDAPFSVRRNTRVVLAAAQKNGLTSDSLRIDLNWDEDKPFELDPARPATWRRSQSATTTKDAYEFLKRLEAYDAQVSGARVYVTEADNGGGHWIELNLDPNLVVGGEKLREAVDHVRDLLAGGDVQIEADVLHFGAGRQLQDWVADVKTEINAQEVQQT